MSITINPYPKQTSLVPPETAITIHQLPKEILEIIFCYLPPSNKVALSCKRFSRIISESNRIQLSWHMKKKENARTKYLNCKFEEGLSFKNACPRDQSQQVAAKKYLEEEKQWDETIPLLEIQRENKRLFKATKLYEEALCENSCANITIMITCGILCCPCALVFLGVNSLVNRCLYGECDLLSPEEKSDHPNPLD